MYTTPSLKFEKENIIPFVSIVIPMRNESKHIRKCLDSLIDQDYPLENYEILVTDGMSEDGSREIVAQYRDKFKYIKLLDNPRKITPVSKNIGIKNARGDIIIILSAHSSVAPNFVSQNVDLLKKTDADCVGGPIQTVGEGYTGKGIALVLSSPFGVGNARFRYTQKEQYVDTVAFGAYRREVFDRIGFFNEELIRNQDNDLHFRLRKSGGKIYLSPSIKSFYYARSSLRDLWKQGFKTGTWNILTVRRSPGSLSVRHFVPLFFVLSLIISLFLLSTTIWGLIILSSILLTYFLCAIFFSAAIAAKAGILYLPILPLIFFSYHVSYGLGSIWGLIRSVPFPRKQ